MLNILKRFKVDSSGQAAVIVAIALVVLLGFAAFAVDIGYAAHQKSVLQNAADSAALAGAMSIHSSDGDVRAKVTEYINANVKEPGIDDPPTVNINRTNNTVKVTISQETPKFFAGVISSNTKTMVASATAKVWAGEALPFVNLNQTYLNPSGNSIITGSLTVWDKLLYGNNERIQITKKNESGKVNISEDNTTSQIIRCDDYGVFFESGVTNASEVRNLVENCYNGGNPVYLLSLKNSIISNPELLSNYIVLHQNNPIPFDDLVVLTVIVTDYRFNNGNSGERGVEVKVLDVNNNPRTMFPNARAGGESKAILVE